MLSTMAASLDTPIASRYVKNSFELAPIDARCVCVRAYRRTQARAVFFKTELATCARALIFEKILFACSVRWLDLF